MPYKDRSRGHGGYPNKPPRMPMSAFVWTEELKERFLAKVPVGGKSECWVWAGAKPYHSLGPWCNYGRLNYKGTVYFAHRLMYNLLHGQIPDDKQVLHSCDNPPCCNPRHLRLGTQTENMLDMHRRGRHNPPNRARGERSGAAKLTAAKVSDIRRRYDLGETCACVAKDYGICFQSVWMIGKRLTWKSVPEAMEHSHGNS